MNFNNEYENYEHENDGQILQNQQAEDDLEVQQINQNTVDFTPSQEKDFTPSQEKEQMDPAHISENILNSNIDLNVDIGRRYSQKDPVSRFKDLEVITEQAKDYNVIRVSKQRQSLG